jgi:hypothetical protein
MYTIVVIILAAASVVGAWGLVAEALRESAS